MRTPEQLKAEMDEARAAAQDYWFANRSRIVQCRCRKYSCRLCGIHLLNHNQTEYPGPHFHPGPAWGQYAFCWHCEQTLTHVNDSKGHCVQCTSEYTRQRERERADDEARELRRREQREQANMRRSKNRAGRSLRM